MTRLWHPFADMAAVASGGEFVVARGQGCTVWDEQGREYLDATASLWYCNAGWGRIEIAEAAARQMVQLAAYSTFGDVATRPALDLAERVAKIAPVPDSRVFFTLGGSDSVDTAVKLVRRYWQQVGQPDKRAIVTRMHAYHGMHAAGTSLAGIDVNREGYGGLLSDVTHVPWDDAEALDQAIMATGPGSVAAFFCEPVVGAGGVYPPPPGYLTAVREVCRRHDVLFVADEVVTGFGRVGAWFASTRFDLQPDLVLCAKGLTSGYLPMGAVLASPRVAEPFWSEPGAVTWRHGYTYSGHAACAAAALANLDVLEREDLPGRALALEPVFADAIRTLADLPVVSEVRTGVGILAAVQLDPEQIAADPALPAKAVRSMRGHGVLTRALATGGVQFSPPLVVTEAELDRMVSSTRLALSSLAA